MSNLLLAIPPILILQQSRLISQILRISVPLALRKLEVILSQISKIHRIINSNFSNRNFNNISNRNFNNISNRNTNNLRIIMQSTLFRKNSHTRQL